MTSLVYDLQTSVHTWRLSEVLKSASEECTHITGSILNTLIERLQSAHTSCPDVFVLWKELAHGCALSSEIFTGSVLASSDLMMWFDTFGVIFYGRGAKRVVKLSRSYKGLSIDLLKTVVMQVAKKLNAKNPSITDATMPTSTSTQLPTGTSTDSAVMLDAACQCSFPCSECATSAKKRKALLQKVRRYKKRLDAASSE